MGLSAEPRPLALALRPESLLCRARQEAKAVLFLLAKGERHAQRCGGRRVQGVLRVVKHEVGRQHEGGREQG